MNQRLVSVKLGRLWAARGRISHGLLAKGVQLLARAERKLQIWHDRTAAQARVMR